MKRYKLIDARKRKGLKQSQLGKELGDIPRDTVAAWEDGTSEPRPDMIQKLCDYFGCTYPYELDLHSAFNVPTQCREDELLQMLERLDRRQLIALFSKLSLLAGIDLTALFSATVIAPDSLLGLCRVVIDQCWNLLESGSFFEADSLLTACVSKLDPLATHASGYKDQAASLAAKATTIQMTIASHQMDYTRRVSLGEDAVKYGELSNDDNTLIMALGSHGVTYTDCYHQPDKALSILSKAVPLFDHGTPLNQADISTCLAIACALGENEVMTRDYLKQARITMPEDPELDPLYRIIELGHSELDQREGQIYLVLAKRFPTKKEYAQLAYDALVKAMNQPSLSMRYQGKVLINKADAARGIGDKDDYLDSLTEGARIAFQMNSGKQISKAIMILQKAPRSWRNEQKYKELCGLLTPNSTK